MQRLKRHFFSCFSRLIFVFEMKEHYTFIVSDESVNSYGYRVLTEGIDTLQFARNPVMLYMHRRNAADTNATGVIGRWENIRKEGGALKADAVFDESDAFAQSIKKKVAQGFLRMASIGILPLSQSDEKKHLLQGQTRPTVTESELLEISIVDMGSNHNALKLYSTQGDELELAQQLPKLTLNKEYKLNTIKMTNTNATKTMAIISTISLALGFDEAQEQEIIKEIKRLKKIENEHLELLKSQQKAQEDEAKKLIDKAIKKGLFPASLKTGQLMAFKEDFKGAKTAFEKLFTETEEKENAPKASPSLEAFIDDLSKKATGTMSAKKDFAWYEKNDPKGLQELQKEKPEAFEKLLNEHLKTI